MTRIKVIGTGQRRIKVTSPGEMRVSPAFLQEALSATFVPEMSKHNIIEEDLEKDDLYETSSSLPKLRR